MGTAEEKFTRRLEAFSDLVFGFSLSLLATRLDVPARVEDIFEPTRWLAVIIAFSLVCRFWLEHHRIFQHHFVVRSFDLVVNFVFLFAVAILPYAVQTFLRFNVQLVPLILYLGDLALVFLTLSILRVRGLQQRRDDPDEATRLRDWRRAVALTTGAVLLAALLVVLSRPGANFQAEMQRAGYAIPGIVVIVLLVRVLVRRLPAFLR